MDTVTSSHAMSIHDTEMLLWRRHEPTPDGTAASAGYAITDVEGAITIDADSLSLKRALIDRMHFEATTELQRYASFPAGWDGYSGRPFADQLIDLVSDLLSSATAFFRARGEPPDEMVPGPASDGSVDLEFARAGRCLILTLYPGSDALEIYKKDQSGSREEHFRLDGLDLEGHLSWLVGAKAL